MLENFKGKRDRSLAFLHGEAASSSIENAGIAYQSPSLLSTGGAAKDIALLSAATNLIFALLLIKLPSFVRSADVLKHGTITLASIAALGWVPLIVVPVLFPGISPLVLVGLWVVSLIPTLLVGPLRDKWVSDLVPPGRIGRYFSVRQIVSAGAYLSTFYMMGYWLDTEHSATGTGFTFIFLIAFLASLVSLLLFFAIRVSVKLGQVEETRFGLFDFLYEAKRNKMGTFMVFVTLVTFSASISSAFFSVYMLRTLNFTYLTYTLVISTEFLARIISLSIWGKLVDNVGTIKIMRAVSFLIPFIPVLWLFSSNLGYLITVQFFSGVWWAAFDLCNQTHICSASPPSKRLHYIVYQRCVITLASAAGPLLGAYLINFIFPVFGNPIFGIFLLSGICRFIVVLTLSHKLKGTETYEGETGYQSFEAVTFPGQVVSGKAFYQYPRFERSRKVPAGRTIPEGKQGLYYCGGEWMKNPEVKVAKRNSPQSQHPVVYPYRRIISPQPYRQATGDSNLTAGITTIRYKRRSEFESKDSLRGTLKPYAVRTIV